MLIGVAFTAHVTLVMATDGAVYGGYDHYLWKIGADGEDAARVTVYLLLVGCLFAELGYRPCTCA